jgi:hypothetical protein
MNRGDCSIPLLSCTIPKLIPNPKPLHNPINKGEVIAHSRWNILTENLIGEEANQGGFSHSTTSDKANLYKFINAAVVFLCQLQQRVVYSKLFLNWIQADWALLVFCKAGRA